jgi:hypothetical protein
MIGNTCQGCAATLGKPPWVYEANFADGCPIYNCAVGQKGYSHCGLCPELPCSMFSNLKDPNMSDEAFRQSLAERIARLKGTRKC